MFFVSSSPEIIVIPKFDGEEMMEDVEKIEESLPFNE